MIEREQHFNQTPKATPINQRFYLGSINPLGTPAPKSQIFMSAEKDLSLEHEGVIYGTNISIGQTIAQIRDFILHFKLTMQRDEEFITEKIYLVKLRELQNIQSENHEKMTFEVDARHLYKFSEKIYCQLIYFPVQMITCFDFVLQELYQKEIVQPETDIHTQQKKLIKKSELKIEIIGLLQRDKVTIKDLRPNRLGRLVSMSGMAVRLSEIYPQMKEAAFRCVKCNAITTVVLTNARVEEPKVCSHCRLSKHLQLVHNMCMFTNKQYIKFQQLLQNVSQGQGPASVQVIAYDSHVDRIRPGDYIQIVGIYRCNPVQVQKGHKTYRQIFNTYFDLISFEVLNDEARKMKRNNNIFSEEQKSYFFKMANSPNVIDQLIDSFAPSIYGHRDIKKGILTQLVGGTKKTRLYSGSYRSEINVCLVGDPSTAKSQLLQQVHKIAPRSVYTCGRGSSAAGLTATVTKDPQTKEFILESGALVLGDLGVCCIDEFDKMDESARTVLLEVMEQQTISIAKAGIVCQLNSRTAILAAANPINSKYDPKKSVIQNINLPAPLLSRFDLLYILLDMPTEEEDRRIAAHILDIYTTSPKNSTKKQGRHSLEMLSKFISFAKEVQPILSEQAGKRLKAEYTKIRKQGLNFNSITATPRLLESMIRLGQAFAKMRLSNEVSVEDVEQAISLINSATLKSAIDPETGIIDMDIITTGRSSIMRKKVKELSFRIKELIIANQQKYAVGESIERFEQHFKQIFPKEAFSRGQMLQALSLLKSQDFIYLIGQDKQKPKIKLQQYDEA